MSSPHAANGIAAMFIATGQDEANVVESHAGFFFCELRANDDLYVAVTLPSLIVATYGGGTSLPTQRECLEMMGCYGKDKSNKLAEIVAATVLAGDISLASAIVVARLASDGTLDPAFNGSGFMTKIDKTFQDDLDHEESFDEFILLHILLFWL